VHDIAKDKGCTAAQLALAWVLARDEGVVPIPGTRSLTRLEENVRAVDVTLSEDELRRLDEILPPGAALGTRYPEAGMASLNR